MTISIDSKALMPSDNEVLFREFTLSALKSIVHSGISVVIAGQDLSDQQVKMLNQEGIEISKADAPELSVIFDENELVLNDSSNKEIFRSDNWLKIVEKIDSPVRKATIKRETKETKINIDLNLDGTGKSNIYTGLKFFDHMLEQIARHGLVDLNIDCKGDLEIDEHHTIEDVAIALGDAITQALGDKKGIERYSFVLPMDEAKSTVAIDLSGRPYLVFNVPLKREYVGDFPTEMLEHFFYSLAMNLKATLHVECTGNNDHHKIEACFKGFARALKTAIEQNERIKNQIPSSKGSL